MSLIDAFAESRNIPALRLADKVGIKKVIEVAHRFGVTSDIPAFLPVAIGARRTLRWPSRWGRIACFRMMGLGLRRTIYVE